MRMDDKTTITIDAIPNKIHYVWMGGADKSELALRCIESWKKYMPDYEIIEWNESNFDINMIDYTREAYEQKKWAFVSDAVRTHVLKEHGGIYFDTDVELFKEPKDIFSIGDVVLGFDGKFLLSTGVMATIPNHPIFVKLWSCYTVSHFINSNEESTINTKLTFIVIDYIKKKRITNGTYFLNNVKILPSKYFSNSSANDNSPIFAIHYFAGSWKTKTKLTFLQYIIFVIKFKLLRVASIFMGNKMYISINDSFWRKALKKTVENNKKGKKIYKVL